MEMRRHSIRGAVLWSWMLGSAAIFTAGDPAAAQKVELRETAIRQIRALYEEKESWSPAEKKMSSQLILELKRRRGDVLFKALPKLRSNLRVRGDGTTVVDVEAEISEALVARIEELGGEVLSSLPRLGALQARMPLANLELLAEEPAVVSIRPPFGFMTNRINTSEGDVAHDADVTRTNLGVDGSGVRVGVLSDGVDSLAQLQASGDLPPNVSVLPGQAGSGSEGTAMLEIVHDLAPGAELLFATAGNLPQQMAQNIRDLRAAGARVIVDDVLFAREGVFQDDVVAQAVEDVTADGAIYFSSAGNSGNLNDGRAGVWEGDFSGVSAPAALGSVLAHDFGGGNNANKITRDSPFWFILQWSDPLGGTANDYDLFLLDADLAQVIGSSISVQDGDDDPLELIDSREFNDFGLNLVIVKKSGASRFLHLNTHRGELAFATDGQTAGHSAAAAAFSVAAVDVATAGGSSFVGGSVNPVEGFSSDGPRRIFYQADGTPLTPGDLSSTGGLVRRKPDIAAADGVATATPGPQERPNAFNPFFGTSAAAPHAAGIAALMLEKNPGLTTAGARAVFNSTALDIEAAGVDRDSGVGIVMADAAVAEAAALIFADGFETGDVSIWSGPTP